MLFNLYFFNFHRTVRANVVLFAEVMLEESKLSLIFKLFLAAAFHCTHFVLVVSLRFSVQKSLFFRWYRYSLLSVNLFCIAIDDTLESLHSWLLIAVSFCEYGESKIGGIVMSNFQSS